MPPQAPSELGPGHPPPKKARDRRHPRPLRATPGTPQKAQRQTPPQVSQKAQTLGLGRLPLARRALGWQGRNSREEPLGWPLRGSLF